MKLSEKSRFFQAACIIGIAFAALLGLYNVTIIPVDHPMFLRAVVFELFVIGYGFFISTQTNV
jgi:hypothetical protein